MEWVTASTVMPTVPAEIKTMEPGLVLARWLESVDRTELNGYELVVLIQARARQIAHLQAELYTDIVEMGLCPPGDAGSPPDRLPVLDEFASDELRTALSLTRRSADIQMSLACELARLPSVHALLRSGLIDVARARVLCEETQDLDVEEATRVLEPILAEATDLTTGQIGARIRRLRADADPEAARRRYHRGLERSPPGRTSQP